MFLKELKLYGFKSFARRTTLEFKDGLTCIVGPNGSGKSNLVDAVRWVLGEQRSSVLRSEKMENVIFSGSKSAKPLGMAEVSMTLVNNRNVLPTEYSEVTVTRRLYRSGESEYLLNKTPCRLKDINNLFLDSGLGPDSYSVIELKMVETILSSKSEERLRLFEEAAGVNKYKQRRNAAFRKLSATEDDLNRVNDIIAEVERNVNALKRQVSRAQRYKALMQEIEELDLRAASLELARLQAEYVPLKKELADREKNYRETKTVLTREEADLERARARYLEVEDRLSRLQNELMAVSDQLHQKENEKTAARERMRALEEKIQRYMAEQEDLRNRIAQLKRRIEEGEPRLRTLAEQVDALRMKHRLKQSELEQFDKLLARRRLELNEARMRLIELMQTIGDKEKERNTLEARLLHLQGRREQLQGEQARLLAEGESSGRASDELVAKEKELEARLKALDAQIARAEKELAELTAQEAEAREHLGSLKNRAAALKQQQAFLHNLIEVNEGYPDGLQFVLKASSRIPGVLGMLADLIDVPARYRLAVEALLGEKAFYVVVRSEQDAFRLMEELRKENLGQVTFLVLSRLRSLQLEPPAAAPQLPGVLARASEVVRSTKELKPAIELLFGRALIVEDVQALQHALANAGGSQGWAFATLSGEVTLPEGVVRAGRYEEGEVVSAVDRSGQLADIESALRETEGEIERAQKALAELGSRKQAARERLESLRKEREKVNAEYQQSRLELVRQQTARQSLEMARKSAEEELRKIEAEIGKTTERLEAIQPEIASLNRQRRRFEDEVELSQEKLEELEQQRNALADEVHELNVNLVKTTGELSALENDLRRMRRTVGELENTIARREQEVEKSREEIARLQEQVERLSAEEKQLAEKKDELLRRQLELKQELQDLQDSVRRKEEELKRARQAGESSADVLQNLRIRISQLEAQMQNLRERIQERYGVEIVPGTPKEPHELEEIQQRLEHLRERERTFGAVNMMALEEYERESERLNFLHKQRNDLVEAKKTLIETIDVINKTARQRFEETFNQIRENFRKNFALFFDGGEGDLRIQFDPEDPLSAKITILARPKGKQLGALELLSAGEKSLTAIALLFSIYQVKPSPFCILDEVDAPLDDVNVRRFLRVLRDFS
ncbi:MAG TPA: chromosome segregation protein SMC, partial [Bacteroidetes bacterium]|nr:chromosome segregation protein SMC [Bacteroidota bacterium]